MGPQKHEENIFYYLSPEGGGVKGGLTNVKLFFLEGFPYAKSQNATQFVQTHIF